MDCPPELLLKFVECRLGAQLEVDHCGLPDLGRDGVRELAHQHRCRLAPGRNIVIVDDLVEKEPVPVSDPDWSAPWSCQIVYGNAQGVLTERRITCQKLTGYGAVTDLYAFCHERGALRQFKIDRIEEMVDLVTGELLDPGTHFAMLGKRGFLPQQDDGLKAFLEIVTFMARCDGEYHPLEIDAVDDAITAYCLRFEVADKLAEAALASHLRIAPSGTDMGRALRLVGIHREFMTAAAI